MRYKRIKIDQFRNIKNIEFELGRRITVISGVNGIGKSSLLALLASTSGTTDKRLNNLQFQPEFTDLFKISPNENFKEYKILVEYDENVGKVKKYPLTKRISFKNDQRSSRGIRLIPRTYKPIDNSENITINQAVEDVGNTSKRVPIPTEYLSLSRLVPLGESEVKVKEIRKNNKIYKKGYANFFKEKYNQILFGSIKDTSEASFINKAIGNKKRGYLSLGVNQTTQETMSVGQDNLSAIISAFTDFYALKDRLGDKYVGGILCIDEIDSSLHPSAVQKLMIMLDSLSEDLNLQIVVTSHSLIVLKKICLLQSKNSQDYKLIYIKDATVPRLSLTSDYDILKENMFENGFENIKPKIKVYCEDDSTKAILKLLLKVLKRLPEDDLLLQKTEFNKYKNYLDNLDIIGVSLGKNHLKNLTKKDSYFRSVLILLDGDAKLDKNIDPNEALGISKIEFEKGKSPVKKSCGNIVRLPTFYSPEVYMYKVFEKFVADPATYIDFWNYLENNISTVNVTVSDIKKKFDISENPPKYRKIHNTSWMKKAIEFFSDSDILDFYYKDLDAKKDLLEFTEELVDAIKAVKKTNARNLFD